MTDPAWPDLPPVPIIGRITGDGEVNMDKAGVPLRHYLRDHEGVTVRFCCEACQASHDVPVAKVVERLQERGIGGEETGVREVARLSDQPCARCGAVRWSTRPGFPLR